MTVGERAPDPVEQELLDEAVDAVSAAYVAQIDLAALGEPVIGLVQQVYWDGSDPGQWAPLTLAIPQRKAVWCAEHQRLDALWQPYEVPGFDVELPLPDVRVDPALRAPCEALLVRIGEAAAYDLVGRYFRTLARRLHDVFGVPVCTEGSDGGLVAPAEEQVVAQLTHAERERWAARGWVDLDPRPVLHPATVLQAPAGPGRVAGVFRQGTMLFATTTLAPTCRGIGLDGPVITLGGERAVLAGLLPTGATGARAQDLFDQWHDAVTGEGAWIAVLPHGDRGGPPPVEFLAADGSVIERFDGDAAGSEDRISVSLRASVPGDRRRARVSDSVDGLQRARSQESHAVVAGASVPALWPLAGTGAPCLGGWSGADQGATGLTLTDGTTTVKVSGHSGQRPEHRARDLLEQGLTPAIGRRRAGRAVIEADGRGLPATIESRPETFALVAVPAPGAWAAVWRDTRADLEISITGSGPPPPRLDLATASL